MRRAFFLSVFAASVSWAADARAGLTLAVPSATYYTNSGIATLDVDITGDGNTSFGAFTLNFAITADPLNATAPLEKLEFVAPPSDPTLDSTLNDPSYVFAGNSTDLDGLPPSPFGSVSGADNTQLSVGDATNGFISDVTLGNDVSELLARLVFKVPTNITNAGGDLFDITLIDPNTSPTALQSNINFPTDVAVAGTFMGVVTVKQPSPAPVPEPGTFGILLTGMTGLLWMKRKRSRTSATAKSK